MKCENGDPVTHAISVTASITKGNSPGERLYSRRPVAGGVGAWRVGGLRMGAGRRGPHAHAHVHMQKLPEAAAPDARRSAARGSPRPPSPPPPSPPPPSASPVAALAVAAVAVLATTALAAAALAAALIIVAVVAELLVDSALKVGMVSEREGQGGGLNRRPAGAA